MSEAPATTEHDPDATDAVTNNNNQQQQAAPDTLNGADQLSELRQIFRSFDRNKDGNLTQLELCSLLRSLGLKPNTDDLDALLHRADTNSSGLVEFSEFITLVAPELIDDHSPYSDHQIRRIFKIFDHDGNGFITADELVHSMAKLGHTLTTKELTEMIEEADIDGDGQVDFREFSRVITAAIASDNVFL